MNKKLILSILIMILFSFPVIADYEQVSGQNHNFVFDGNGNFNSDLSDLGIETVSVSSPGLTPFISDLDNDSQKEIIIYNSNSVEIYRDSELSPVDSYIFLNLSTDLEPYSIIFDIDGDGNKEIIAVAKDTNPVMEIVEYNGTHIYLEQSFMRNTTSQNCFYDIPDPIIQCRGVNDCILVTPSKDTAETSAQYIRMCSFNSTGFRDKNGEVQNYNSGDYACVGMPSIPRIEIKDYDNDNTEEYIFSYVTYLRSSGSGGGNVKYMIVDVDDTGAFTVELDQITNEVDYLGAEPGYTAYSCSRFAKHFTATTTDNFDGFVGDGMETIIGMTDDEFTFIMESHDQTGTLIDRHPDTELGDPGGELVSNIMVFDSFPDSDVNDFCVMGFDQSDQLLNLLCSSFDSGLLYNDDQVFEIQLSEFDPGFNISSTARTYNRISHAGQHRQTLTDGKNLNELVCSYGVFSLDYSVFAGEFLIPEWLNEYGDGAVISDDAESKGLDDILILTDTNLWYIDDLLTNQQAYFNGLYEIDPCIEQPIKLNESMRMFFTATDDEGDDINFTAYVYYGDDNEQVYNEVDNSGSTFTTGLFQLNKTIVNGDIRVEARDINPENQDNPDIQNFKFTVSSDGVEYGGDCVTTGFIEGVSPTDNETIDNTTITESDLQDLQEAVAPPGLIPEKFRPLYALLILVIVIIGTIYGLVHYGINDPSVLIYIPLTVGLITWLFLVFLRMIAGWTVIVAILLATAFIGAKFIPLSRGV